MRTILFVAALFMSGCMSTQVNIHGCGEVKADVRIEQPKTVSTNPSLAADVRDVKGIPGL